MSRSTAKVENNIAWDCVDKHARSWHNPHKTSLIAIDKNLKIQKLSYRQLQGLTHRAAHALQSLGLKPGDRVLLRLPNEAVFPITFLGAIGAGLIPIPTSPLFTWEELQYLLQDSEAKALITSSSLFPQECLHARPTSLKEILIWTEGDTPTPLGTRRWQDLIKKASSKFETIPVKLNDPAYWLYTSGTTGKPKAAIHAHRSIRAHDGRAKLWQNVRSGDVIFNTSALNWSYALTAGLLDMWRHGLTSVIYEGSLTPKNIFQVLTRTHTTLFMSVPGIYRRLVRTLADSLQAFAKVRVCLSAGESLSPALRNEFQQLTELEIYEGLGMTENSVYLVQPFGERPVPGSVGKSIFGNQVAILREDGTQVEAGETGILATQKACPGLMLGYHGGAGTIEQPFQSFSGTHHELNWFLSGDLAYQDASGNFFFVGRRDDVITAGGYRISPLEVEQVLKQHPQVREAAVVGEQKEEKTFFTAHLVLHDQTLQEESLIQDIQDFAAKHLAAYKIPRRIVFCESLPKTVTGKLKRSELK